MNPRDTAKYDAETNKEVLGLVSAEPLFRGDATGKTSSPGKRGDLMQGLVDYTRSATTPNASPKLRHVVVVAGTKGEEDLVHVGDCAWA